MHERLGIDRDPDVRRPRSGRVEEQQIAWSKIGRFDGASNAELFRNGPGDRETLGEEHVTNQAAAIEARRGVLAAEPVRRAAQGERFPDETSWNDDGWRAGAA